MTNRRRLVLASLPAAALALGAARLGSAQPARLEESDPIATSLGYKHDASKVDAKKFPTFAANRICANCQLFQAKAGETWGPCTAVGGKLVNANGWCIAWVAKQ
jgi:hypothetical protein